MGKRGEGYLGNCFNAQRGGVKGPVTMKHRDLVLYELKRRLEQKRMSAFIRKMAEIKSAGFADPAQCEEKNLNPNTPELYQVREGESNVN